jgi:crossover junction endodeoxyribonuclease RusA
VSWHYLLRWPPSLNHLYPTARNGRRFLSVAGKQFKQSVWADVLAQGRPARPLSGRLSILIEVFPPDRRVRDLSNLVKIIEDSLTDAGVWKDDGQIDDLHVIRRAVTLDGAVRVTIKRLP